MGSIDYNAVRFPQLDEAMRDTANEDGLTEIAKCYSNLIEEKKKEVNKVLYKGTAMEFKRLCQEWCQANSATLVLCDATTSEFVYSKNGMLRSEIFTMDAKNTR